MLALRGTRVQRAGGGEARKRSSGLGGNWRRGAGFLSQLAWAIKLAKPASLTGTRSSGKSTYTRWNAVCG